MGFDLAPYVGKQVLLQFSAPNAWLTCANDGDRPALCAVEIGPEGKKQKHPVPVPFIVGKVLKKEDGGICRYVVEFNDEQRKKLEVCINPDMIFCVTEATAAPRIELVKG